MSVHRQFLWICNACGHQAIQDSYGMPVGFVWFNLDRVNHLCAVCSEEYQRVNGWKMDRETENRILPAFGSHCFLPLLP